MNYLFINNITNYTLYNLFNSRYHTLTTQWDYLMARLHNCNNRKAVVELEQRTKHI